MRRSSTFALSTVLAFASALSILPILWILLTAVRPQQEVFSHTLHILPSTVMWQNLVEAWRKYPVATWLQNSIAITFFSTILSTVLDLLAGYAFAKFQFRGRDILFGLFLLTLMLPVQVFMAPQFLIVAHLHGVNTMWAAFVPRAAETYGVFLARQFFLSFPDDLINAARLDGASELRIFWSVVLPLSRPAVAVLVLLLTLGQWNDFGWSLVVLRESWAMTLPVGLNLLQGDRVTDWPGIMSVALVSIVPIAALFFALQSYFVQGVTRSGIK